MITMNKERIITILEWASHNRAEDYKPSKKPEYYWTPQAKQVLNKVLTLKKLQFETGKFDTPLPLESVTEEYAKEIKVRGNSLLIGVIGKSGVGKTMLGYALESEINNFFNSLKPVTTACMFIKFERHKTSEETKHFPTYTLAYTNTIIIDMPDYAVRDVRKINSDLNELYTLWEWLKRENYRNHINLIILFQKELVQKTDHFFLRKMDIVELKPLTPEQLIEAFKMKFTTCEPFTEEALKTIAELSRGVFRRFMHYNQLCLENMVAENRDRVTVENVNCVINSEVLMKDLDLELTDIFHNERYKRFAVDALKFVRQNPNGNQKTIAEALGIHEGILGRIMATLESNGYVKRTRGKERGEWLVLAC
jgi:hypothetical protein